MLRVDPANTVPRDIGDPLPMLVSLLPLLQLFPTKAFIARSHLGWTRLPHLGAENGVNMGSMTLHLEDAEWLGDTIRSWLDSEFIALPVHKKISERVQAAYVEERSKGVDDLGEMLMRVGSSLEETDFEDAFVGPWDIANKVLYLNWEHIHVVIH